MDSFIRKHAGNITGILRGFDRMLFRGTLLNMVYPAGMFLFLNMAKVLRCDFGAYAEKTSKTVIERSLEPAERLKRPVIYLPRSGVDKEEMARDILEKDPVKDGLICVLKAVEPCKSFRVKHIASENRFEIASDYRKCLHLYHYFNHSDFGFMHARLQTWFPFNFQICLNGREWLARSMDKVGLGYQRDDNCFPWIEDFDKAQKLADRQVKTPWHTQLRRIANVVNPALPDVLGSFSSSYYWSLLQSEWAIDITFKDPAYVERLQRQICEFAMTSMGTDDIIRYLGRKPDGRFRGDVTHSFKDRREGVRVKHWLDHNSLKLYGKGERLNLLRGEATINDTHSFKLFRHKQGDPDGERSWRVMRQGIADLPARAKASNQAVERYFDSLASADTSKPLGEVLQPLSKPVRCNKQRVRGLRPWSPDDIRLIQAVSNGKFVLNGFRNRDLAPLLFDNDSSDDEDRIRNSRKTTRLIRLLRAHGLIRKVPRQARYRLSKKGREVASVLLAAQALTLDQMTKQVA